MVLSEVALNTYKNQGLLTSKGKPRLAYAREFFLGKEELDFQGLQEFYKFWMSYDEYVILQRQEWFGAECKRSTVALLSPKRGNDAFLGKLWHRLLGGRELVDCQFFDPHCLDRKTPLLFVTLTCDPSKYTVREAWESIGDRFNRWMSRLRKKFGKVRIFRVWESFKEKAYGYPHIHVLLCFLEHKFSVFRHKKKWRLDDLDSIKYITVRGKKVLAWDAFIDVQGCQNVRKGFWYCAKYLIKSYRDSEGSTWALTSSLCWIFRRQSYAISKTFCDLIMSLANSNRQLGLRRIQTWLFPKGKAPEVVWVFIGVVTRRTLMEDFPDLDLSGCYIKIPKNIYIPGEVS